MIIVLGGDTHMYKAIYVKEPDTQFTETTPFREKYQISCMHRKGQILFFFFNSQEILDYSSNSQMIQRLSFFLGGQWQLTTGISFLPLSIPDKPPRFVFLWRNTSFYSFLHKASKKCRQDWEIKDSASNKCN